MALVHAAVGVLLFLSHAIFLFRGLALRRNGGHPGTVDRIARAGSHFGLPLAVATGFLVRLASPGIAEGVYGAEGETVRAAGEGPLGVVHAVLGLLPFFVILAFAPLRPLKRRIPWLLPAVNLVLFFLAAATGIALL